MPAKYTTDLIAFGCPDKEAFAMQKEIAFAVLLHSVTPSLQFTKLVEDAGSYAMALIAIVAYVAASAPFTIAELKCRMKLIENQCCENPARWPTLLIQFQNALILSYDAAKGHTLLPSLLKPSHYILMGSPGLR